MAERYTHQSGEVEEKTSILTVSWPSTGATSICTSTCPRLANDDVTKQRSRVTSVPYPEACCRKVSHLAKIFITSIRREVLTELTNSSQLSASHFKDIGDRTSAGPFFGRSTISHDPSMLLCGALSLNWGL